MRGIRAVTVLALLAACGGTPKQDPMVDQGRTYTDWLLNGRLEQLYAKFSPEMRNTFSSVAELSSFVSATTAELGAQRGKPVERVTMMGNTHVYTRTAQFERASRPVEVQWTLDPSGQVTGLLVHDVPADSGAALPADSVATRPADTTAR
jgi:hypothetical protein